MNTNYNYPKDEFEFYSRPYSVDQLVKNYDFNHLMAYYLFGINTLERINYIIENNLYCEVDRSANDIYNDKMFFVLRIAIIRNAMSKITACEIAQVADKVMLFHLN